MKTQIITSTTAMAVIDVNLVILPKVEVIQNEGGQISIVFWTTYGSFNFTPFANGQMSGTGQTMKEWVLGMAYDELAYRFKMGQVNEIMARIRFAIEQLEKMIPQTTVA